ncbi:MAG: AAA family ATPase [Eubacterium sp.]|nr:AAA family ATPase [Eubacterium sp.]
MEKINIVVCSNDTEYKVALKNKLVDENFAIIGYSDIEPNAKVRIQGFVPDIVAFLVDSYDINTQFADFIEDMNLASFGAIPVILTDKVTVDIVNLAAQAGVKQVLDLEIDGKEFCENMERLVAKERRFHADTNMEKKTRSTVYGLFSGKGGVGKTTIAANVAVELASRGKKTLLIDLDLQFGDADMALDLNPTETIVDVSRDGRGVSIDNLTACCTSHPSGLSLLASPPSPELAEYVTSAAVKSIIDIARNYFEYILIDCGCSLTDPVITAIESSDVIFMVNDVNILSLKRAKVCLNVIQQLNQKDKAKLIINKNVKKNTVTIEDFENLLGIPAYAVVSSDFKTVNSSLNNGQPITTYKPRSPIAKDIISLVDTMVLEREGKLEKKTNKKAKRNS